MIMQIGLLYYKRIDNNFYFIFLIFFIYMSDRKRNWSMSDWNYKRKREFKEGMYKTRERFMKLMSPEPI